MKCPNVCGKAAIVFYASQQAMSSRLNSDSFNFWHVKNMIKMFYELCVPQLFVRVALKTRQLSGITEAIIYNLIRKVDKGTRR